VLSPTAATDATDGAGAGVGGGQIVLTRVNGTANDNQYVVPAAIPLGNYSLALRVPGGGGGDDVPLTEDTGEDTTLTVTARAAAAWPVAAATVYPVNTTAGIWAALNATAAAGGGTVLLSRGRYDFSLGESIDLPPFTTLRGVDSTHVHLVWHTDDLNMSQVPKYFVGGNATFAVVDLSISSTRFYNNVIADGSHDGN